ncbi:hypothetical protein HGRIS_004193 [Hohenbuehelia grisea]|uniref:F-box domain-containing protein n=1 Tax=Hohenbuehelia grisea TaxID=104357 RepID=A0ABR3JIS2_9AGAR
MITSVYTHQASAQPILRIYPTNAAEFLDMPTEILEIICRLVSDVTQLSLCLVCRRLNEICTGVVYHTVSNCGTEVSTFAKLCRTLTRRPEAAIAVRDMQVYFFHSSAATALGAFSRIFQHALRVTTSLVNLRILTSTPLGRPLSFYLQGSHFPRLKHFGILYSPSQEEDNTLYEFLFRHLTIRELSIQSGKLRDSPSKVQTTFEPLVMSDLRKYSGSDAWLGVAIPHSRVEHVVLSSWYHALGDPLQPENIDRIVLLLSQSKGVIQEFSLYFPRWDARILSMVQNLNDLSSLLISVHPRDGSSFPPDFLDTLEKQTLPHMPRLQELILNSLSLSDEEEPVNRVEELEIILRCQKLCPLLEYITFPSFQTWRLTRWQDSKTMIWTPLIHDSQQAGFAWAMMAIVAGQYSLDCVELCQELQVIVTLFQSTFPHWKETRDIDGLYTEFEVLFSEIRPNVLPKL